MRHAPRHRAPHRVESSPNALDLRRAYPAVEPPVAEPVVAPQGESDVRAFLATAVLLVAIWALTGAGYFWPVWPILGWGLFALAPLLPSPMRGTLPTCRRNASSKLSTTR
jgi:fatty acid desaturase